MPRVIFAPEAEDDLTCIAKFIARDSPKAARKLVQRLRKTCNSLATQPDLGEIRDEFGVSGCRTFSVGNYVIFFRRAKNGVEVARIVHGNRDLRNI